MYQYREREVRQQVTTSSAGGRRAIDPQLANIGKERGLEIWRIKKFGLEKLPKEEHGNFCIGDSYIILYTKSSGAWNVHFWLGSKTSTDEMCTAAIKTVELDDMLGGLPVQYREVQNHESPLFMSYFKDGIRYLTEGDVASGLKHVGGESRFSGWKPRLFHCKGKRNVRCAQVDCNRNSLNLGDVFMLDCGDNIYVWMPPEAGRLERIKGMSQAVCLRTQRSGKPNIEVVDQDWDTNNDFWKVLGGKGNIRDLKSSSQGGDDESYWRNDKHAVTLWRVSFRVSDETGSMQVTKISEGDFRSSQLDSKDAFILDAGNGGIFVWVGRRCTMDERKNAMQYAQAFLEQQGLPPWTQVVRVLEGAEPAIFTQWASEWETSKPAPQFQPKLFQCSNQSGRLTVEEIANFDQEDLDGDDVMILDGLNVIFVWVGAKANSDERSHAEFTARRYLETDSLYRPVKASIKTVNQGYETPEFKKFFKSWDDNLFRSQTRTVEYMRSRIFS